MDCEDKSLFYIMTHIIIFIQKNIIKDDYILNKFSLMSRVFANGLGDRGSIPG